MLSPLERIAGACVTTEQFTVLSYWVADAMDTIINAMVICKIVAGEHVMVAVANIGINIAFLF